MIAKHPFSLMKLFIGLNLFENTTICIIMYCIIYLYILYEKLYMKNMSTQESTFCIIFYYILCWLISSI